MSGGAPAQAEWSRFVQALLVFVLAGPLIGGVVPYLVINLAVTLPAMIAIHGMEHIFVVLRAAFTTLAAGMLYAVLLQIIPAILSGAAIAGWEYVHGRSGVWLPVLTGVLSGVTSMLVYRLLGWPADLAGSFISAETVFITLGSLVGSIACWWLVRPRPAGIDAVRRPVSIDKA
jgi:hypothetical protein